MSLKKIAQKTGTSVATVSRVLNHADYQCQNRELADRIRQTARELGYVPNQNARMLKMGAGQMPAGGQKRYIIDILLARFRSLEEDPFFAEMFR